MKRNRAKVLMLVGACGLAAGLGSRASAQPFVINIQGSTLQQNFIIAPAASNEFLEINGVAGSQQLAPSNLPSGTGAPYAPNQYWIVQYRATNSGNGLTELVNYGRSFVTVGDDVSYCPNPPADPFGGPFAARIATGAWVNGIQYIANGCPVGALFNANHAGGAPVRSIIDPEECNPNPPCMISSPFSSNHQAAPYARFPDTSPDSGVQADISPLDVPLPWLIRQDGEAGPDLTPSQPGYGFNTVLALNPDGTVYTTSTGAHQDNLLVPLGSANIALATPDCNTIYTTPIAFAPVSIVSNFGTGMSQITKSELRHLAATGRMPSGENLTMVTREGLSGTRNSAMNSICLDPSWGVGENIGQINNNPAQGSIGPSYLPSNKNGSGDLERAVINTRLAIGYTGAERGATGGGFTGSFLSTGKMEVLGVQDDLNGGTEYPRPTIDNILDNGLIGQADPTSGGTYTHDGYRIGAFGSWNTFGDPRNEAEIGGDAGNCNPRMRNAQAAAYVNNVTRSIEAFNSDPGNDQNAFKPGEYLAFNGYVPPPAIDYRPLPLEGCMYVLNSSPDFVFLQEFVRAHSVLRNPEYATYGYGSLHSGGELAGNVPTRETGHTYSDGVSGGATNYVSQGGAMASYGSALSLRNRVSGDFNGDGRRDMNDIPDMIGAWIQRNGGAAWTAPDGSGDLLALAIANSLPTPVGADAIIEVLGDFTNDGNFGQKYNDATMAYEADRADVRYFADGLAIDPSTHLLNRAAGFAAVDNAYLALTGNINFFGTTLATGHMYPVGGSAGDVAGPSGLHTPGYNPIGADGVVDAHDIDYIYSQFRQNPHVTDGELNWDNLSEVAGSDLSADVTGDLKVNQADVDAIVITILGTTYGDVNLDGVADATDLSIANANLGNPGGWAMGDVNGDGVVTQADIDIITSAIGGACPCDFNGDMALNSQDFFDFLNAFFTSAPSADFNMDHSINSQDFFDFLNCFFSPPNGCN